MNMAEVKRLYRSRTDRQISGVCGGLAAYFDVDPTLIRIVFVAISLMGGPGLLLYIVLALVVPEEPAFYTPPAKRKNEQYPVEEFVEEE